MACSRAKGAIIQIIHRKNSLVSHQILHLFCPLIIYIYLILPARIAKTTRAKLETVETVRWRSRAFCSGVSWGCYTIWQKVSNRSHMANLSASFKSLYIMPVLFIKHLVFIASIAYSLPGAWTFLNRLYRGKVVSLLSKPWGHQKLSLQIVTFFLGATQAARIRLAPEHCA